MSLKKADDRTFASVLADGRIHINVPDGTEGAVVRKYKTSDGKEGSKTEMVYSEVSGMITKLAFRDGEFGSQLQVTITDGDEKPIVLSLGTSSNFGEDMMKKLMNVDMELPVRIKPYSFADAKAKLKKGVTIYQTPKGEKEEVKIGNYFYDEKTKKNKHGFPEPKKGKKPLTKDQWKLYFAEAREFLVETITEHFKLDEAPVEAEAEEKDELDGYEAKPKGKRNDEF